MRVIQGERGGRKLLLLLPPPINYYSLCPVLIYLFFLLPPVLLCCFTHSYGDLHAKMREGGEDEQLRPRVPGYKGTFEAGKLKQERVRQKNMKEGNGKMIEREDEDRGV